jgi:siroheme synthase (precorrin-2 oxidase/ferrochelatase)
MKKQEISIKNVEIEGKKLIQVLIPDYADNKELLELPISSSGNSYGYANGKENCGYLTVQVNAYVKKDTMELLKAHEASEEARKRMRESAEQTEKLNATLTKLSPLLENPNLDKLLAMDESKLNALLAKVK